MGTYACSREDTKSKPNRLLSGAGGWGNTLREKHASEQAGEAAREGGEGKEQGGKTGHGQRVLLTSGSPTHTKSALVAMTSATVHRRGEEEEERDAYWLWIWFCSGLSG